MQCSNNKVLFNSFENVFDWSSSFNLAKILLKVFLAVICTFNTERQEHLGMINLLIFKTEVFDQTEEQYRSLFIGNADIEVDEAFLYLKMGARPVDAELPCKRITT